MFLQNTMSNPFDSTNNTEQDEISLFLQQILLRSSSSSSSSSPSALIRKPLQCSVLPCDHIVSENQEPEMGSFPGRVGVPDPCSGLNSSTSCWVPANVSSSYVGTFDNDPDEYDCESEEGIETLVEEAGQKRMASRNSSSKRSRAAEVHNLSEKRRRSRINEKMKALQNLIPNSNKTDKASMLDEAIEYLKQLQLQVQMLTLRNGLSLYPICLPGMLPPDQISQTRVDVCERSKSLTEKAILMEQDISANTLLSLQDNCPKQVPVADFSTILGSKPTFELESSFQNHFEPFQFSKSSAGVCRDELLSCQQPNNEWTPTTLAGHFGTRPSNLKDHTIEACLGRGGADKLPNLLHNTIFSSQLKSSNNGVRPPFDDIKTEGDGF